MLWFRREKEEKTTFEDRSVCRNPYENFEVEFHQEAEIHRRWQHIEEVALRLKSRYETNPYLQDYIDVVRSVEKVFVQGEIKHWTNDQIREELARNHMKESSDTGRIDKDLAQQIYENFKEFNGAVEQIYEVIQILLAKYGDKQECVAFILYLQDVYVACAQSNERGESSEAFKERFIEIRMEVVSSVSQIDMEELRRVYEEFKDALWKQQSPTG